MSEPASNPAPSDPAADLSFDRLLADFQSRFPDADVEALRYGGGRMIVRTPDEATYSQFVATTATDRSKTAPATAALCRRCILWPDAAVVDALFARKPALAARIADKLLDKAGAAEEISLGK